MNGSGSARTLSEAARAPRAWEVAEFPKCAGSRMVGGAPHRGNVFEVGAA